MREEGCEGPLAEFVALRQEIDRRSTVQQNTVVLQLTLTGAIASFALSSSRRSTAFVIVPVIGYMLWSVYAANFKGSIRCAEYIRTSLSSRVPGGLLWEDWLRSGERGPWRLLDDKTVHAHLVAFTGVSLFACAWAAIYAVTSETLGTAERIIFAAAVLGDVALVGATTLSIIDVIRLRRRWTPTVRP